MMAVNSQEQNNLTDSYPLLIECRENHENQHLIDVERGGADASSSDLSDNSPSYGLSHRPGVSTAHSGAVSSSRSDAPGMREEGSLRHRWIPFNTLLWISIELVFTLGQIIASIVVLSISQREITQKSLFAWVVGYAAGCAASLPLLYWRFLHRHQATEQGTTQVPQPHYERNSPQEPNSYITISFVPSSEEETHQSTSSDTWSGRNVAGPDVRINMLVDHFKMALDCFFAVWFVVGNIWIFRDHSSSADAPDLYRLCIVFLTFSCIGYAMPFILCGMICCCLPCIISILGIRENMNQMRGASEDSISALPTHKFKLKRTENKDCKEDDSGVDEGGLLAAGTENERAISGEDAVCCICLANYTDNDLLRELPCIHLYHTECVDRWLKINASCPLCKFEISVSHGNSSFAEDSNQQQA